MTLALRVESDNGGLAWEAVVAALKDSVGAQDYATWLAELKVQSVKGQDVVLSVPTRFMVDWIEQNFKTAVVESLTAVMGVAPKVSFAVAPVFQVVKEAAPAPVKPAEAEDTGEATVANIRLDPRYTFETFVMGRSNEFAFRAAQKAARDGGAEGYNPLFIHGGVGLGKTHLMHAIAHEVAAHKPKTRVMYVSSERFYNMFMHAMRVERNTLTFKNLFNDVDVLMVDDIQFIAGKTSTQEEFFNTFNRVVEMGKQVILTADRSPVELDNVEDRLKSRMGAGVVIKVNPPEVETRLAILQAKAESLGVVLEDAVLNLLGHTIASNVRELEGALNRVVAASRLMGQPITTDFAREQLADLFRIHTRVATVDDIQRIVADYFKIRVSDMHSPRRMRNVARPRQVAMYLCKTLTTKSYPDIGRAFGGKDHTTVMHGVKAIENLLTRDAELAEHVGLLEKMVGSKG